MRNLFKSRRSGALVSIGLALGLSALSTAASAISFNFANIADNNLNPNYIGSTELEWRETAFAGGLTIGGLTLIASGSNANGTTADAFFDKGNAGLGVCSTAQTSGGSPNSGCRSGGGTNTSDDNVSGAQGGETLTLAFDKSVKFDDILFRNAGHGLANGTLFINGDLFNIVNGALANLALLTGTNIWNFKYDTNNTGTEFYINLAEVSEAPFDNVPPVPLPAALPLYGTGLAVMGFIGWRRKRKTAA